MKIFKILSYQTVIFKYKVKLYNKMYIIISKTV